MLEKRRLALQNLACDAALEGLTLERKSDGREAKKLNVLWHNEVEENKWEAYKAALSSSVPAN